MSDFAVAVVSFTTMFSIMVAALAAVDIFGKK